MENKISKSQIIVALSDVTTCGTPLKVLVKLFQKLADSKGRAFGRAPQGAESPYFSRSHGRIRLDCASQ